MSARSALKSKSAGSLGFSKRGQASPAQGSPPPPSSAAEAVAAPVPRPGERVFINDDLTRPRARLAARARKLRREGQVQDTWVYDGDIYVKKAGQSHRVITERQLEALL